MYGSDIRRSDVKETAEHVYFVGLKHYFCKFRTETLVFISELPRARQGGAKEFFHSTCMDELKILPGTRLSRRSGGVRAN